MAMEYEKEPKTATMALTPASDANSAVSQAQQSASNAGPTETTRQTRIASLLVETV